MNLLLKIKYLVNVLKYCNLITEVNAKIFINLLDYLFKTINNQLNGFLFKKVKIN